MKDHKEFNSKQLKMTKKYSFSVLCIYCVSFSEMYMVLIYLLFFYFSFLELYMWYDFVLLKYGKMKEMK